MKKYRRYFTAAILAFIIVLFLGNAGRLLDVTKSPKPADIIVSLGGDNGNRIKKTLKLYKDGFSKSGYLILTGVDDFDGDTKAYELDWRALYLYRHGVPEKKIIYNSSAQNTKGEVEFIKDFMLRNRYKSVIFITCPPHSRRLSFFIENVFKYKEADIEATIVGSDEAWWDKNYYFLDHYAVIFSVNEYMKLAYYYSRYLFGL